MQNRPYPLLCELHAHTRWSDGSLTVTQLVDLYGLAGFDVLCVTDHVVPGGRDHVTAANHAEYLASIDAEAERASDRYGLLVIPGLELTYEDGHAAHGAHVVALGLRQFVGVDDGIEAACTRAREAGAALIGAHPYAPDQANESGRSAMRLALEPGWAAALVDRFELINRHEAFPWVAERRLPAVASGDFHLPSHLGTWKTGLACRPREQDVLDHLCSDRPAHLVPISAHTLPSLLREAEIPAVSMS